MSEPRQWVNKDRTVLITMWPDGTVTVALRDDPGATWGPPISMEKDA